MEVGGGGCEPTFHCEPFSAKLYIDYQDAMFSFVNSYLCFERVGRAIRDPERIIISLKLVKDVVKAKPFAVLPGSGMSIEVTLQRGDRVKKE